MLSSESGTLLSMSKRPYRQHLRAEAAEANRQRVLDALYDRLRATPAEPASVDEIARAARVSRSTVYLVFGSRSGLFDALTDRLLRGAGYDRIEEAVRDPDARETLRGGLEGGVRMYAAHHDVLRVLYATGKLDPEGAGRAIARSERRRFESMGWLGNRLHEQNQLRPGVTPDYAAHVIWLLASFDAYDLLAAGRGLDAEEVVDVLTETAQRALLREGPAPGA
jgi:AcrR family transcriptional regulator